jgi:peroxiredoxin Q/BCP
VGSNPTSPSFAGFARRHQTNMSTQLAVGDRAPDFHGTAVGADYGSGRDVSLQDFRGRPLVLYFYPKDDTPGCTAQACGLRDNWSDIKNQAELFGVSVDPAESHTAFVEKYNLPFPLLSDPEHKIVNAYGVWVDKNMYGKKYKGTERSTFVIDPKGRIAAIFRKVKPEDHVDLLKQAFSAHAKK